MEQTPISNQSIWDAIQQLKLDMFSHFDTKTDNIQSGVPTLSLGDHVSELEQRVSSN